MSIDGWFTFITFIFIWLGIILLTDNLSKRMAILEKQIELTREYINVLLKNNNAPQQGR
jgi:hypothetical protein